MLRLFSTVLKQLNNLVIVVDREGEVSYVGPSVERMLGYKPHELLGNKWWLKTCTNIADPEQRKQEIRHFFTLAAKGAYPVSTVEYKLNSAVGDARWFLWNCSAGPDNTLIQIGYDITERKRKEQEILDKNKELFNRNKEIFDSLEYARNIQQAILPSALRLKGNFAGAFAMYQPKDVVSGDFYWAHTSEDVSYIAVADCTGHGVPGALMTMTANALLKEIIVKRSIMEPARVLGSIDAELEQVIHVQGNNVKANDGMDIALVKYNRKAGIISFAGAFRPLLHIRKGQLAEYPGSRFPIGFYHYVAKRFEEHEIKVEKGDMIYLFSDGYIDQFGGMEGKKFNKKNFKELLLSMHDMDMPEQKAFLEYSLLNWRQKEPQTDDILVAGFKV